MPTTTKRWQQVGALVGRALDIPVAERAAFLDRSCEGDELLRQEVEALLEREARLGDFLAQPFFTLRHDGEDLDVGRRLGPYRLGRRLGSGGMGTVYLADREDGELRQQVAIKLLRRGLDTEEILHRFQRERQILADLAHPFVARLLDAGTADDGRPFLVMEYVQGEPIDVYCDTRKLDTRARVSLFRRVCTAVQFAHRNLVVHRDLKPANVLITADGTPKLLDFGIAKLLAQDLRRSESTAHSVNNGPSSTTSSSLDTSPGASPLTSLYASPEQRTGGAITTATDVYALGVMLYKFLTGHHPHSKRGALERSDKPPIRPSLVIQRCVRHECNDGSLAELTPNSVSQVREGSPRRLARRLAGDLDSIVLKALQPEPELRFSSAEQLSEDLRRYLEGRPVRSRPASVHYRAGKFIRRNALGVSTAFLIAVLMLGSGLSMAAQRQVIAHEKAKAEHERDRAEEVTDFVVGFLRSLDPSWASGDSLTGHEVLGAAVEQLNRELSTEPETRAELLDAVGGIYRNLGIYDEAKLLLESALRLRREIFGDDHVLVAETLHNLGRLERHKNPKKAEELMRWALEIQRRHFPQGHRDLARGLNNLALHLNDQGQLEEAEILARESLAMKRSLFGPEHQEVTAPLNTLAAVLSGRQQLEEAEALYRECLRLRRRLKNPKSPRLANVLNGLAEVLVDRDDPEGALPLHEEALKIRREIYDDDDPRVVSSLNNLGRVRTLLGEAETAVALLGEGLAMERRRLKSDKWTLRVAALAKNLAWAQLESGDFSNCIELARPALETLSQSGMLSRMAEAQSILGGCLAGLGQIQEAEALLVEGYRGLEKNRSEESLETRLARERLLSVYKAWGRAKDAASILGLVSLPTDLSEDLSE